MRPIEPGAFTTADLELTPDDGMRYELVDGVLMVTPSSLAIHQRALQALFLHMVPACPEHLEVFFGPLEFRPNSRLALVPDLLVVPCKDAGTRWIDELLLAVEVLAPATRTVDEVLKRKLYEQAGVASYWMFDPKEAKLTVLELEDARYVERGVFSGHDVFEAELPFPVKVAPSELSR
jgi:Uma2 family endonuclease